MHTSLLCGITLLIVVAHCVNAAPGTAHQTDCATRFGTFQKQYGRQYSSQQEEQHRQQVFCATLEDIAARNARAAARHHSTRFGVNRFADLTTEEFAQRFLTYKPELRGKSAPLVATLTAAARSSADIEEEERFDWRDRRAVTPVKDQKDCGSCWAMSAVQAIESSCFLANVTSCQKLPQLSVQQIVSCCNTQWSSGCSGGFTEAAFFCALMDGLEGEATYPYTARDDTCVHDAKRNVVSPMAVSFRYATAPCMDDCAHQNETQLKQVLRQEAPVSVCIDASVWQTYQSGVIEDECPGDYHSLNHCALLTGWSTDDRGLVWNTKNSWGRDWGEDGFIRLRFGKNVCGIADDATVVFVSVF